MVLEFFSDDTKIDDPHYIREMASELEPYLGPYVAKSWFQEPCGDLFCIIYDLEFHPLKSQAEAAKSIKDVEIREMIDSSEPLH